MTESIAILDFGSQYAQIIARRVREANVYCELFPWDAPQEKILSINPKGFILSGGPKSVYEENAPYIQKFILESGLPILGICYGMQALTHALGGEVSPCVVNGALPPYRKWPGIVHLVKTNDFPLLGVVGPGLSPNTSLERTREG